ncbi:MAG: zinc finger domain-containing protein [Solirubrobacteraceae bacterium]
METWTTYYDTEAITWERVGGVAVAVRVERDRNAVIRDDGQEVDCPRCKVRRFYPCISSSGNRLSKVHSARKDVA